MYTGDSMKKLKNILPGLVLLLIIYFMALRIDSFLLDSFGIATEVLTIGIILGMLINNTFKVPTTFKEGIRYSLKSLLKLGIILLGFKLNFLALKTLGGPILLVIVLFVPSVLILAFLLGKIFKIEKRLAALIGVGSCSGKQSMLLAILLFFIIASNTYLMIWQFIKFKGVIYELSKNYFYVNIFAF